MEKTRHRGVDREDRSGVGIEERRGERVRKDIDNRYWKGSQRLIGEVM